MGLAYDSGWVPVASGTIRASAECSAFSQVQVIIAASGANTNGTTAAGYAVGAGTPVPWNKLTPNYPTTPLITGTYTVAAPTANLANIYYVGNPVSGSQNIAGWVPQILYVSTVAGAASWARVIISGK